MLQLLERAAQHREARHREHGAEGEEAAQALGDAAWGKPMFARVEDREAGVLLVTLIDDAQTNVNEALVSQGLLRVAKSFQRRAAPLVESLREKELGAKKGRAGMWRFGDIEGKS